MISLPGKDIWRRAGMLMGWSVGVGVSVTVGVWVKVGEAVAVAVPVGDGVASNTIGISAARSMSTADWGSLVVWLEQAEVITSRTSNRNQ